MSFIPAEIDGLRLIEGRPEEAFLQSSGEASRLVEACWSAKANAALVYPKNLTAGFFDLSSGEAGAVLQTLRNYQIRLAVVCEPGSVKFSSRFGEMVDEERRNRFFGVFGTREKAIEWLGRA